MTAADRRKLIEAMKKATRAVKTPEQAVEALKRSGYLTKSGKISPHYVGGLDQPKKPTAARKSAA